MAHSQELPADRFVKLVLKHEWRVRAFTATILGRPENIEDIVQDIYTIAWAKRDQFRYEGEQPDEEFVRWVCTIGRYEALKNLRKKSAALILDEEIIDRLVSFQFEENAYLEARRNALAKCLKQLREADRNLIRNRYSADQTVEEIAEQEGKTASAIYKALDRIRMSLLNCVGHRLSQEGF